MSGQKSPDEDGDGDDDLDILLTHSDCVDDHLDPDVSKEGKYSGKNFSEGPLDGGGFTSTFTSDSADAFAAYFLDATQPLYEPLLPQPSGEIAASHTAELTQHALPATHDSRMTTMAFNEHATAAGMRRLECLQSLFPGADVVHLQTVLGMMDCLGREQFQSQILDLIPFIFDQNANRSPWPLDASILGLKRDDIESSLRAILSAWTKEQKGGNMPIGNEESSLLVARGGSQSSNKRKHSNVSETSKSAKKSTREEKPAEKVQAKETKDRKRHACPDCEQIKKPQKGQKGGASHVCPDTIDVKDSNGNILFSKKKVATHLIYDILTDNNGQKELGKTVKVTTEYSWIKIETETDDKKLKVKNLKVDNTTTKSADSGSQTVRSYLRGDHKGDRKLSVDVGIEEEGDTYKEVSKQVVAVPLIVRSMSAARTADADAYDGPIPDPVIQHWQMLQSSHDTNEDFDPTGNAHIDDTAVGQTIADNGNSEAFLDEADDDNDKKPASTSPTRQKTKKRNSRKKKKKKKTQGDEHCNRNDPKSRKRDDDSDDGGNVGSDFPLGVVEHYAAV